MTNTFFSGQATQTFCHQCINLRSKHSLCAEKVPFSVDFVFFHQCIWLVASWGLKILLCIPFSFEHERKDVNYSVGSQWIKCSWISWDLLFRFSLVKMFACWWFMKSVDFSLKCFERQTWLWEAFNTSSETVSDKTPFFEYERDKYLF